MISDIPRGQTNILDELIDKAVDLPVESQNLLLVLAKGMAFTRDCIMRQCEAEQKRRLSETIG